MSENPLQIGTTLRDVMQNIEVTLGDNWLTPNLYIGTKEDLIAAGIAKEYMFAKLPKRNKWGYLDVKGWQIDRESAHDDQYDWLGETRPISWDTKRIRGGRFRFCIDKSWEEQEALKTPPLTKDTYWKWVVDMIIPVLMTKEMARGSHKNSPKGYHLSNHHEIAQLIDRVVEAVKTSTVITTRKDKPFTVIKGGKE